MTGYPLLNRFPWTEAPAEAQELAREVLQSRSPAPSDLATWLDQLSNAQLAMVLQRSVERATHYKWNLGPMDYGYTVWLHQYRTAAEFSRATSFAASVHNHRYGFVSRVLSGALYATHYALMSPDKPVPVSTRTLRPGDVMTIDPEEVHRVERVDDGTLTLLIQGPPRRRYSRRFDLGNDRYEDLYDLDHLLDANRELWATGNWAPR